MLKHAVRMCAVTVLFLLASGPALALDLTDVQEAVRAAGAQWTAGETAVSQLPPDEWRGLQGVPLSSFPYLSAPKEPATDDRGHIDWRDHNGGNYITDIRNQGGCGSCVAFGALAGFEAWVRILLNEPDFPIDLSEQHLFSCGGGSCNLGWMIQGAMNYCQNNGVPDNDCLLYRAVDNNCDQTCPDWRQRALRLTSWSYITTVLPNTQAIKNALAIGPVAVSMIVYDDFQYYTGGIYHHVTGGLSGGHEVCIVGYDDAEDYWIVKNSWGRSWGEEGFFRIRRGDSMIGTFAVQGVPQMPPPTATPTLTPPASPTPTAAVSTATPTPRPSATPTSAASPTSAPTATPTRTPVRTPTRTPAPSPSPEPTVPADLPWLGIFMSDTDLAAGDEFHCWVEWHDGWEALAVRQFAVLEVFGDFYFAPQWTKDVSFIDQVLPGAGFGRLDLLKFAWPSVPGRADGLRLWAAFLEPASMQVLCDPAFVEFSYGR